MGVAKAKASVKGRNAFHTGFLYAEMQIAYSQRRILFATTNRKTSTLYFEPTIVRQILYFQLPP